MGIDAQMFIRTKANITPELVLEKAWLLASAFGKDRFMICRNHWSGKPRHCLSIIDVYHQDGDDITPENGETFIECHLWTRYYGKGYARGDLPLILSVAKFLEYHFPGCEVWYGGDSSGVCAEALTEDLKAELWEHFCQDRNSYHSYFSGREKSVMCSWCEQPMLVGTWFWGGRATGYYCSGCDEHVFAPAEGEIARFDNKKAYEEHVEAQRIG